MLEKVLWLWLTPLATAIILLFLGKRLPRRGDWLAVMGLGLSLTLSLSFLLELFQTHTFEWREQMAWLSLSGLSISFGWLIDPITILMLCVVTTVSFLVHLYSTEYLKGDPNYARYFAYLSFFTFSMLGLVLVDNLLWLYIFWELVGLASYLLIGFWFEKKSASDAAKKAFLTTRIGDVGFFIGIMLIFYKTGGLLTYDDIFKFVAQGQFTGEFLGIPILTLAGILLFLGAMGKSAQFPLHVWLPDAMEGPTPVSALIHAATMVAAGVYMVTRLYVLFTPEAQLFIAYIGAFTAFFAATMALTHTDIKKVLAYSTISQLGYMMMGLGVGAYVAGFLHLVTHAAFKACLFLCSGSVIHATHTQDMREMGGLKSKMPITFWTMLIATLSISGIPFFSGFVSKDLLLAGCLSFVMEHPEHLLLALFAFITAGMTAFYMFRLLCMTFLMPAKNLKVIDHAHESPWAMTLPLCLLSGLSFAIFFTGSLDGAGLLQVFGSWHDWFNEVILNPAPLDEAHGNAHGPAMALSLILATGGILLSYLFYLKKPELPQRLAQNTQAIYQTLIHLYWIDELYQKIIIQPLLKLNTFLADRDNRWIDQKLVDGWKPLTTQTSKGSGHFDNIVIDETLVDGSAVVVSTSAIQLRKIQTGKVQQYVLMAIGAFCILLIAVYFL